MIQVGHADLGDKFFSEGAQGFSGFSSKLDRGQRAPPGA
jgi:hypothetical protein